MAAVSFVSTQKTHMPKGKIYLKGRYTNMKKFLAIFMVVAVVMGMAFVVMSSADEADFLYTVNVGEPADGKVNVSVDVKANKGLNGVSLSLQVADGATIVAKATDRDYYSKACRKTTIISMDPLEVETVDAFEQYLVGLNGQTITFTLTSTDDSANRIGGSNNVFPSEMKGLISFDIEYNGTVDADTVKVVKLQSTTGTTQATVKYEYNLPVAPTTTTEEPVPPTTTEEPVPPTTTEEPVPPTTTEEPVPPTTTEDPDAPTTTADPDVPTTTEDPAVPTTTAKDPNTSDSSMISTVAFIAIAIVSLACAVVVIIRRKRA